jgi:photosystem II stability/assembly factor-like uncharacterized protein
MQFKTLFLALTFAATPIFAQQADWPYKKNAATLPALKTGFEAWLEAQEEAVYTEDHVENELDGLQTKFMRWYYLMQTRVDAEGRLPDPAIAAREWHKYRELHPMDNSSRAAGWEAVGTAEVPANGGGVGRINVVVLHPDDPNTIFIGSAGGGVWKTPDGGSTWTPLTDNIPVTSIADIAINPVNPDIIYIATGDGYGYEATWQSDNDFWGGVYSCGVMKSIDGGLTWEPTGLSYLQEDLEIVQRLLVHPETPDILLASTRNGIFRSTDAGTSWSVVESSHCHDMAFNAANPDIIYAVGNRDVLISEDAGASWSILKDNLGASGDRMSIETTAADDELIYVLSGNWSTTFHKSTNGGTSWSSVSSPSSKTSFYGYYDNAFAVSPVNGDLLFGGGLEVVRSTNGATSWTKKSNWSSPGDDNYVHADNHAFAHHPTDDNIIYSGNDGGLFRSDNQGDDWVDISSGLRIAQIYRLGTSATDPERVLSGWQDNGTNLWDGTSWEEVDVSTWDGMEAIIDFTDPDIMFLSHQYGGVYRTTNGGDTWTYMNASGGGWVTPYIMDPNDHEVLYYGASGDLYRTTNGGDTWVYKSAGLGSSVFAIAVAPSNSNVVYAASLTQIKRSSNMGDSWTNITSGLSLGDVGINYITISDTNEDELWIALSGYDAGEKVYHSTDGGDTWENVSGTLPNVPVNTIVYENGSDNRVYVGTDIGVFYKDDFFEDWLPYMTGLPNVMIHELEINYTSQKLVAATYGRGIWQSDLAEAPSINASVIGDHFCVNEEIIVNYASTIEFLEGNTLTAELSDASGSFSSPLVIGTLDATAASGSITAFIAADQPEGAAYRIRVNSTLPAITGVDNGIDLFIGCEQPADLSASDIGETSVTLNWEDITCAESYDIRYREPGGDWIESSVAVNSITLTGLTPLTDYEWSVQSVCVTEPLEIVSGYTADAAFSTLDEQTGINSSVLPFAFELYPNPLSGPAQISFELTTGVDVQIVVFDRGGREVARLLDGPQAAGKQTLNWNADQLAAGVYTIQLAAGDGNMYEPVAIEFVVE